MDAIFILKIVSYILGFICLYFAWFVFETEQGKIQNRLEEWWIKIDDKKNISDLKFTQFLIRVAIFAKMSIDKIYGEKLFSYQSVWVSFFYLNGIIAIAPLFLSVNVFTADIYLSLFLTGNLFFFLALLPKLIRLKKWIGLGFLLVVCFMLIGFAYLIINASPIWLQIDWLVIEIRSYLVYIFLAYLVCISFSALIITFFRFAILRHSECNSGRRMFVNSFLLVFFTFFLIVFPFWLGTIIKINFSSEYYNLITFSELITYALKSMAILDFVSTFPVFLYIFFLIIIPLNKLFWLVVSRPLYTLAQYRVFSNKAFMTSLFLMFIGWPLKSTLTSDSTLLNDGIRSEYVDTSLQRNNEIDNSIGVEDVTCNSAILYGTAMPNGSLTYAWFEYGTTPGLGETTKKWIFLRDTPYNCLLTDLDQNTTYFYRGVAENEFGKAYGKIWMFTTKKCEQQSN